MKTTYALLIFILFSHFSWADVDFCEDDFAVELTGQITQAGPMLPFLPLIQLRLLPERILTLGAV